MAKKSTSNGPKKTQSSKSKSSEKSAQKKTQTNTRGSTRSGSKSGTGSSKKSTKKSGPSSSLVKEINGLMEQMDEAGLNFLKQQAEVILYTTQFEEARQKTMNALADFRATQPAPVAPDEVVIKQTGENSFVITANGRRVFFNRTEMRELTRICHAAADGADAAPRLYRWFERERKDFLLDTGISNSRNPALPRLHAKIVSTYKVAGK